MCPSDAGKETISESCSCHIFCSLMTESFHLLCSQACHDQRPLKPGFIFIVTEINLGHLWTGGILVRSCVARASVVMRASVRTYCLCGPTASLLSCYPTISNLDIVCNFIRGYVFFLCYRSHQLHSSLLVNYHTVILTQTWAKRGHDLSSWSLTLLFLGAITLALSSLWT